MDWTNIINRFKAIMVWIKSTWKENKKLILELCFFIVIFMGIIRFGSLLAFLAVFPWISDKLVAATGMNMWLAKLLTVPLAIFMIAAISFLFSRDKKKHNIGLAMFAGGMCLWYMAMFIMTKDLNFNPDGTPQKCVAQNIDGYYEDISCSFKVNNLGFPVMPITPEIAKQVWVQKNGLPPVKRILPNKNLRFFDPNGNPLLWYYQYPDGKLEFFDQPGKHPQFPDVILSPVNPQVVQALFAYIDRGEAGKIMANIPQKAGATRDISPEFQGLMDLKEALTKIEIRN